MDIHNDWKRIAMAVLQAVTIFTTTSTNRKVDAFDSKVDSLTIRQAAVEKLCSIAPRLAEQKPSRKGR